MPTVYDPEKQETKKPDGNTASPEYLMQREELGDNTDPKDNQPAVDPTDATENEASSIPEDSLYKKDAGGNKRGFMGGLFNTRKKRVVTMGAVLAATLVSTVVIFLSLLPLKILHIVSNLENHFFGSSNSAMSQEVDQLESNYIKKYVLPSLKANSAIPGKKCGTSVLSTIDRNCRTVVTGKGLVNNLYQSWAQAGLEHTLAEKYGIEFSYQGGHYQMKAPGLDLGEGEYNIDDFASTPGESLDDFISKDPKITQQNGSSKNFKAAVAAKLDQAMQGESRYKQVMYKYKVGKYLEQKFGIKRCIVACDARRDFSDWKNKKTVARIITAQRVLQPNNQILAFVLGCIGSGKTTGDCSVIQKADPAAQPVEAPNGDGCTANCIAGGEPLSLAETSIQATVDELALSYALDNPEEIAKAQQIYEDLTSNGGYKKFLTQTVLDKLLSASGAKGDAAKAVSNFGTKLAVGEIPGVGYVLLAAQVNNMAIAAGVILPAMGYMLQTQTMVHQYAIFRTYADEAKTGNIDATMVGSFTDALGPGDQNPDDPTDAEIGGTAGAEQTPLYNYLIDGGSGTGSSKYLCANGKPVPAGRLVCAEEKADAKSKADVSAIRKNEPAIIRQLSGIAGTITGWLNDLASGVLKLFGLGSVINKFTSLIQGLPGVNDLFNSIGGYLRDTFLPIATVSSNTSGGRTFDLIAGGNDVSANDFAHNGLGGVALTAQQSLAILNSHQQQQNLQDANQPLLARVFNTHNDSSLVSKLAMAMPSNSLQAKDTIASIFTNPFGKLAGLFSSALRPGHAAAATAQADPFDITQYGYPINDPIFNQDPEAYWNKHCTTNTETVAWNTAAAKTANSNPNGLYIPDNLQPSSGQKSPTSDPMGTNPCLLIQAAVGSAGGIYDSSLLTPDDLSQ